MLCKLRHVLDDDNMKSMTNVDQCNSWVPRPLEHLKKLDLVQKAVEGIGNCIVESFGFGERQLQAHWQL